MSVRRAGPADARAIAAIYVQSARYHRSLDPDRYVVPDVADVADRYERGRQHPADAPPGDIVTLVAVHEGQVTGFVDGRLDRPDDAMHPPEVYCYVAEIAVEESHRSQGVGAALLAAAEEWARERGAAWVYLEHLAANVDAGRFYRERMGYRTASVVLLKRLGGAR